MDVNGTYACGYFDGTNYTCSQGYEGKNCEVEIDFCQDKPCNEEGTLNCTSSLARYSCDCKDGFKGDLCGLMVACEYNDGPCVHGMCTDLENGDYACGTPVIENNGTRVGQLIS